MSNHEAEKPQSDSSNQRLAKNLAKLMIDKGINTKMLNSLTGISVTAINALKRGQGNPTLGTLLELSKVFNLTLDELVGDLPDSNKSAGQELVNIPIYNINQFPLSSNSVCNGYIKLAHSEHNESNLFAVEITNNALQPLYEKGSLFVISSSQNYTDGDILLIIKDDRKPCLRKIYMTGDVPTFHYLSLEAQPHSFKHFEILGVVIKIIQSL